MQPIGASMISTFNGANTWGHNFTPRRGAARPGGFLADVTLVVEHGDALRDEPAPYFYRFRYNDTAGKWQPFLQVRANAFDDAPDCVPF